MPSNELFQGHELPSHRHGGFDRVPGSMAHLAEPLFDPAYMIPEGTEPFVADRDYFTVRVGADGSPRSVLVIARGERVDPARVEALRHEQEMIVGLDRPIVHDRHAGRRPVSSSPEGDDGVEPGQP